MPGQASVPDYQSELRRLRDRLLLMGAHVEEMISSSVRALVERDSDLGRRTIDHDREVNRLEVETDRLCLDILALRHPLETDLRSLEADKTAKARKVGELLAERAKAAGVSEAVFDRGGNRYAGRVAAIAEGAREGGLAL